jgi:hypothetical protein
MKHRPKVYRPQGWIAPVLLVDGRVAAVWEHAREGNLLRVKVARLEPSRDASQPVYGQKPKTSAVSSAVQT